MELYFSTRGEWRSWLEDNHAVSNGVWLICYKKKSGKPRISYEDAVEEALCFGWIDSKLKSVNEDYYIQYFTPRRPGSLWSKLNIERVKRLIDNGLIKPQGLAACRKALENPRLVYDNRTAGEPEIPGDLMKALMNNKTAHDNFIRFSLSGRRMYLLWLNDAKREETRQKRIKKIVEFSEQNKKPGMM